MTSAFIFQNQNRQYLNRNNEWVDGSESQSLLKTLFKDEALNIKAEHSVKNPELRLSIVRCALNSKGQPQIEDLPEDNSTQHLDHQVVQSGIEPHFDNSNSVNDDLDTSSEHELLEASSSMLYI